MRQGDEGDVQKERQSMRTRTEGSGRVSAVQGNVLRFNHHNNFLLVIRSQFNEILKGLIQLLRVSYGDFVTDEMS